MNDPARVERNDEVANFQELNLGDVSDDEIRTGIGAAIDLMENINRGTVAEVIVATALGGRVTEPWGDWDVELDDKTRVEVKSTGLVQAWPQRKPSTVTWQIHKTQGWELGDDGYTKNEKLERRSDFYVLAMHDGIRPDMTDEWMFYVISTRDINEVLGNQKNITEGSVRRRFDIEPISYEELSQLALEAGSSPRTSSGPR
jgi:hypothetical protein